MTTGRPRPLRPAAPRPPHRSWQRSGLTGATVMLTLTLSTLGLPLEGVGRGGITLSEQWSDEDLRSYVGTLLPNFPNMFLIMGPNAGASHGAGVNIYSEAQVHYILTCIDILHERKARCLEPTVEAHDRYNDLLDHALSKTVWNHPLVTTYYKNSQNRNFISCPWRIVDFWHLMRAPELEDMTIS